MARHDQRASARDFTCVPCKRGNCFDCVDVLRAAYTDQMICTCTRKNHSGEPVEQQVTDPFTGAVVGPNLTVTQDGTVIFETPTLEI